MHGSDNIRTAHPPLTHSTDSIIRDIINRKACLLNVNCANHQAPRDLAQVSICSRHLFNI